jgi:hypothetical protein
MNCGVHQGPGGVFKSVEFEPQEIATQGQQPGVNLDFGTHDPRPLIHAAVAGNKVQTSSRINALSLNDVPGICRIWRMRSV